jgi:protein SCO1/2
MRIREAILVLMTAALAAAGFACRQNAVPAPPGAAAPTNQHIYQVKGVIREIMPERRKLKIEHEAIPGYMEKMTMIFDVKDGKELAGLQPNEAVSFRMIVTDDDGWIDQIRKTEPFPNRTPVSPEGARRVREVDPLVVGDSMPDYKFTNQVGQTVHLSDFKGQAYALTFIFTRCPFPTFCPQLSRSFQNTQAKLKAMTNGPANWHLFSLTIDPQFDTPAVLQDYARRHRADPKYWSFLTGELIDIDAIAEQFGLQFWRTSPEALPNHNVRTVVVDAAGRVQWITPENEWKPEALAEQLVKAAAAK